VQHKQAAGSSCANISDPSLDTEPLMAGKSPGLLEAFRQRGLIFQSSPPEPLQQLLEEPATLYCGFDPTADSLHVGSLLPLLTLRRFQEAGHRPLVLIGGGTGLVGDPSFREDERSLQGEDTLRDWSDRLERQLRSLLDFGDHSSGARLVNNLEWSQELRLIPFLREIGKHFPVNAMVRKEAIRQRLEREDTGISFTEFSYMLLQAYDYLELNRRHGCRLQIGGSDQWGNITAGIDLVRRVQRETVHGLTLPLLTRADGGKFGKTAQGNVWLSPERTSPYAFYQFWINSPDQDVYRQLQFFSWMSGEEIAELEKSDSARQGRREAQPLLARELTERVHGTAGLAAARRISEALFSGEVMGLTEAELGQLALDGLPTAQVEQEQISLDQALVETGLAVSPRGELSLSQARRLIRSRSVTVNTRLVEDERTMLGRQSALHGRYHLLRRGKKAFGLLCWPPSP